MPRITCSQSARMGGRSQEHGKEPGCKAVGLGVEAALEAALGKAARVLVLEDIL